MPTTTRFFLITSKDGSRTWINLDRVVKIAALSYPDSGRFAGLNVHMDGDPEPIEIENPAEIRAFAAHFGLKL